ncbi:MAG: aldo/keto reductase [Balneolaceae bacterium]|nr:MAG: aldo/keto reductase [Balneolaceae bacterium]
MERKIERSTFLKQTAAVTIGLGVTASSGYFSKLSAWATDPLNYPMPTRPLGRTGHDVSIFSLGGQATLERPGRLDDSVEIINRALDLGVNYIDTANMYGQGVSEEYIGEVMKYRRKEVFLATKSHDYTYDGTMRMFEQSLKRLQTDYIDLYQHHFVGGHGPLERLGQKESARDAFNELKEQGVIRFTGVTGHSSKILSDAIEEHPYDCALITLNAAGSIMPDADHLDRFFRLTSEKEMGVIAMKVMGGGGLIGRGFNPSELLTYVLSYPISTAIVGISIIPHLEDNVRTAKSFRQMSDEEMVRLRSSVQS